MRSSWPESGTRTVTRSVSTPSICPPRNTFRPRQLRTPTWPLGWVSDSARAAHPAVATDKCRDARTHPLRERRPQARVVRLENGAVALALGGTLLAFSAANLVAGGWLSPAALAALPANGRFAVLVFPGARARCLRPGAALRFPIRSVGPCTYLSSITYVAALPPFLLGQQSEYSSVVRNVR